MKKRYFLLLLIPVLIFAGIEDFLTGYVVTPEDNINFGIKGTAKDTSAIFETRKVMSFKIWGADTTGSDSVDVDLDFQTCSENSQSSQWWSSQGTYTIDADSSSEDWLVTAAAIQSEPYGRIILEGSTNHIVLDSAIVQIRKNFFPRKEGN